MLIQQNQRNQPQVGVEIQSPLAVQALNHRVGNWETTVEIVGINMTPICLVNGVVVLNQQSHQ